MTLWDPEVLARVGHLQLVARQTSVGLLHGQHRAQHTTKNVEFADYKPYTPGDPVRDVDWGVAARTDRLVVRRHHAETELPVTVVLDASGDMGTGQSAPQRRPPLDRSKFGVAVTLAACLLHHLSRRGEPVGLQVLGGAVSRMRRVGPGRGPTHLAQIFAVLADVRPGGTDVLSEGLAEVGRRLRRRQVVVVISDFMEEPSHWGPTLAALGQARADLRAVHIYDPREWRLDYERPLRLFSPEGGNDIALDPAATRAAFAEVVQEYTAEVGAILGQHRGVHLLAPTDAPLSVLVRRVLEGR